jgi:hypothetical protein
MSSVSFENGEFDYWLLFEFCILIFCIFVISNETPGLIFRFPACLLQIVVGNKFIKLFGKA